MNYGKSDNSFLKLFLLVILVLVLILVNEQFLTPTGFVAIGGERYVNTEDNTVWLRTGPRNDVYTQMFNADGSPKIYEELSTLEIYE